MPYYVHLSFDAGLSQQVACLSPVSGSTSANNRERLLNLGHFVMRRLPDFVEGYVDADVQSCASCHRAAGACRFHDSYYTHFQQLWTDYLDSNS